MPPTSSSLTIEDIPPEVVLNILSNLLKTLNTDNMCNNNSIQTLNSCRLTCKYLNTLAQPLVFQNVTFRCEFPDSALWQRIATFRRLLHANHTLAAGIKELVLHGHQPDENIRDHFTGEKTGQFWSNLDLPLILDTLSSVRSFTCIPSCWSSGMFRWDSEHVSGELRDAITRLCRLPTMVRIKVVNVIGFPLGDILTRATSNLTHLDIKDIDAADSLENLLVEGAVQGEFDASELGLRYQNLRLVAINWNPITAFRPMMEKVVPLDTHGPQSLNAIIYGSKDTLQHLSIQFLPYSHRYSTAFIPALEQYNSLQSFAAHWYNSFTDTFASVLGTFLTHQFSMGFSCITHFEIRAYPLPLSEFYKTINKSPSAEWHTLDSAIKTAFPHLETLVISMLGTARRGWELPIARTFFKHVLPVATGIARRVLLRIDGLNEVDMTDFTVDIPLLRRQLSQAVSAYNGRMGV